METEMMRVLVAPPALPPAALAELKQWLGVTVAGDDDQLTSLLRAGLDVCADFTGIVPLACTCEESMPAMCGWLSLSTRPVTGLTWLARIGDEGVRTTLDPIAYDWAIDADGTGRFRLHDGGGGRIAVRITAGLAADWNSLPEVIRHGLIRLAAHQYRNRENPAAAPLPPASVAALWRPWRRLRLA